MNPVFPPISDLLDEDLKTRGIQQQDLTAAMEYESGRTYSSSAVSMIRSRNRVSPYVAKLIAKCLLKFHPTSVFKDAVDAGAVAYWAGEGITPEDEQLLNRAIARDGSATRLAKRMGLAPNAPSCWRVRGLPQSYARVFRLEEDGQAPAAPVAAPAWDALSAFMAAMPPVGTVLTAEARDAALLKFIEGARG